MSAADKKSAEAFARKFAEFLHQRGFRVANVWTRDGFGVRVYIADGQFVSVSRDGDLSSTSRGKHTFRRDALYRSWRSSWDLAVSDYEAWREGTRAEREAQRVLHVEPGDWFDVTEALRGSTPERLEKLRVAQERGLTDWASHLLLLLGGTRLPAEIRSAARDARAEVFFVRLPAGGYRVFARESGVE